MPRSSKKQYAARLDREALAEDAAGPKYEAHLRDLHRFPIKPPPRQGVRGASERWLLLADAHFPFVDTETWSIVKDAARDLRPRGVVIMGDWCDFASISGHGVNIEAANRGLDLLKEFASGGEALDELDEVTGFAADRWFLRGNHEWRVDRYLVGPVCPGAVRGLVPSVVAGLHLKERGYTYVEEKPTSLGRPDMMFLHGHFYNKHHAAKHLEALHSSCVYGHTHMPQQYTHSVPLTSGRRALVATGLPTMRDLQREWHEEHRVHTWINGFGVAELIGSHTFIYNVYVQDGVAAYGGHRWVAR